MGVGSIGGTVTDDSTALQPIVGITVFASYRDATGQVTVSTTTGDGGAYQIDDLDDGHLYLILFFDPSGAVATQWYSGVGEHFDFDHHATAVAVAAGSVTANIGASLPLACRVSGVVTDVAGNAVKAGSVTAIVQRPDGTMQAVDAVSTDQSGKYEIGGLSPGLYRIEFKDTSGDLATQFFDNVTTPDCHDTACTPVDLTVPGTHRADVDACMTPAGRVTGFVTDAETGAPLARIGVGAQGGPGNWFSAAYGFTDGSGKFTVGGLPTGDYRFLFWSDASGTYLRQDYRGILTCQPWIAGPSALQVRVEVGALRQNVDAALVPKAKEGAISGSVTGDGVPLAGVLVTATQVAASGLALVAESTTAATGAYTLPGLLAGRDTVVHFRANGWASQWFDAAYLEQFATRLVLTPGVTSAGCVDLRRPGRIAGSLHIHRTARGHVAPHAEHLTSIRLLPPVQGAGDLDGGITGLWTGVILPPGALGLVPQFPTVTFLLGHGGDWYPLEEVRIDRRMRYAATLPPGDYVVRFALGDLVAYYDGGGGTADMAVATPVTVAEGSTCADVDITI